MPKRKSPPMTTIKISPELRKQVALVAEQRGCFQHRVLGEAISDYLAKLQNAKAHPA